MRNIITSGSISASNANYNAYKYCESIFYKFNTLSEPLLKYLNIGHFCYLRMYPDGRYLHLSNDLVWSEFYYQSIHDNTVFLEGEGGFNLSKKNNILSSFWPEEQTSLVTTAIYEYGFWGGYNITIYSPEYSERWAFFSKKTEAKFNQYYLQFHDAIEQYIGYFKKQVSPLLEVQDNRLGVFHNGVIYPSSLPLEGNQLQVEQFLESIGLNNHTTHFNIDKAKFTKRELESLAYLAQGLSTKQIADKLKLSQRTIEYYLRNIKYKTGFLMRSDLVKFYQDNIRY